MATFLYRLGRFSFRRRRLVLMLWIAVLAAVGIGAASVSSSTSDSFTLPGTQSQKAIDLLGKEFPQASAAGASARVVFEAPDGTRYVLRLLWTGDGVPPAGVLPTTTTSSGSASVTPPAATTTTP